MPGVTISAGYGAGGSIVAPMVAERLGLPLLDRAISVAVAAQLNVSVARGRGRRAEPVVHRAAADVHVAAGQRRPRHAGRPRHRPALRSASPTRRPRSATRPSASCATAFATGAVVLGRAGAAAFRDAPDILRVRLFGPAQARAARAGGRPEPRPGRRAEADSSRSTHARDQYVRRLYRISVDDPSVFTLQTRLDRAAVRHLRRHDRDRLPRADRLISTAASSRQSCRTASSPSNSTGCSGSRFHRYR